jgi:5-methylthioribose kinase
MDLGFFLSHLLLKAARRPAQRDDYFGLTRTFWDGYRSEAKFAPTTEWEKRGIAHCGLCLLARIDGTSPVEYLPEEAKREAVRRLGRAFLLERPATWGEALTLAESEVKPLAATEKSA